jgi:signal transduction histidine kinase/CheY-like chemotaxis protein
LNQLTSIFYEHEFLFKYTILPIIPLIIIALLSIDPLLWISSEVHHFYIELFAVVFGLILSFYYLLRAKTINDNFSLFIGLGFLISAMIDLLHVIISYNAISNPLFIKYFIPQTWFAGRIFLSSLLTIAILKYSKLAKGIDEEQQQQQQYHQPNEEDNDNIVEQIKEQKEQQQEPGLRIQKRILIYLILLGIFSIGVALASLYLVFPSSVIDEYSLHRPYEIPPLILFSVALFFFYKRQLYKRKDLFYKGLAVYLILDIFSQIIMSYSAVSFDTAHNIAHVLKDAAYFVNIIALSLSSIQSNVELKKSNELIRVQNKKLEESGKMQKEFINIAAHELRTPIQPILGLSDLLIYRSIKGTENYRMAEVINRNAIKLQHLAEDILDVTKIEGQTLILNKERFDLNDLIINIISDFENSTSEKSSSSSSNDLLNSVNVKMIYKPATTTATTTTIQQTNPPYQNQPIVVEADKTRISQVLSNLLSNANKSSSIDAEEEEIEEKEGDEDRGKTKFIFIDLKRIEKRKEKVHHHLYLLPHYTHHHLHQHDDNLKAKSAKGLKGDEKEEGQAATSTAVVSIQDEGSGIKSELRSRLYEKFATGCQGGTGLGLFISKNIIEAHGGNLWFEDNKDGKGVTFYFTLPIFAISTISTTTTTESPHQNNILENQRANNDDNLLLKKNSISSGYGSGNNSGNNINSSGWKDDDENNYKPKGNRITILLVDDDNDINITLRKVLEEKGYEIHAFSNPKKALGSFEKDMYNLIILDIKMPKMNGFEFYEKLRNIDSKVKVCFLTAGEMNSDKDNEIFSKNLCLRKPIENEALLMVIKNLLEL